MIETHLTLTFTLICCRLKVKFTVYTALRTEMLAI